MRYIIEIAGLDDPDSEWEKAEMYARMRQTERLFRLEAKEFVSRFDDVDQQAERILRDIANDLLRQWTI